jgi:hypothetical protein
VYSRQSITGVAAQQAYALTIEYLSSEFLTVTVDGSPATFTVSDDHDTLTISSPTISGGEAIEVVRSTPAGDDERLVDFQDLAQCRQQDLDRSSLQLLHIAQETLDVMTAAERLELNVGTGQWDGESRKIQAVADGVASSDAVNKGQLDAVVMASGNLPVVGAGDNDKSLWVVSGAWDIRTPAQARVHLGLGTAAQLDAGSGASEVVQFDGSARYPAADGSLIDISANPDVTNKYLSTLGVVVQSSEATPNGDATATWTQTAGSRLTPGTLTDLNNSSDITVDNGAKRVTLSAGTWEIEWRMRAYNQNTTAGNDQILRVAFTDDDDTAGQVVYESAAYDRTDIEAAGSTNKTLWTLGDTLLLKLPSGGTFVMRAVNESTPSADIRIPSTSLSFRKVSTST